MMLVTMFYIYAALGVGMFGGMVYTTNPLLMSNSTEPDGKLFGDSNYYPNNFNDFMSAIVTLFELMIVNNWFIMVKSMGLTVISVVGNLNILTSHQV